MFETKQLLILGNGFDVHCDLKSNYIKFFRSEILDLYSEKCGYPKMKKECCGFWEELLFNYYLKFGNLDYKWCNIEKIIEKTLWSICFENIHGFSSDIEAGIWKTALKEMIAGNDPNNQNIRNNSINKYLLKACTNIFYDLGAKINRNSDTANLPLLLNVLLDELHNFENRFCKYMKDLIVNPNNDQEILSSYIFKSINLLLKIISNNNSNIFVDITEKMPLNEAYELANKSIYQEDKILTQDFIEIADISILSFNYTNVFDILQIKIPCNYTNVHGKLCTNKCYDCNKSNIIFGIDDTAIQSQNEIPKLRLFSKTYRKMQNLAAPINTLPIINNNQLLEIKFYGHSLSSADYSYFQSIFDFYNIYNNNQVSLIFYYSKGYEQFDAIYDLINIYGNTLANKDQGKNLMHKLLLENRLKIVEIE